VLISESTALCVRGQFELVALEPMQVKGKSLPLKVFSVMSAARSAGQQ
jgi:class 3 adenylate cyclase